MTTFTQKIAGYSHARLVLLCSELQDKIAASERAKSEPIAIVGMGCRFPGGAQNPSSYWQLLRDGVDAISEIPRGRWNVDGYYDPDPNVAGKMYCKHGGFLAEVDGFDPEFFNMSPREALSLDPQQRLLLEVVWETLEDAAQDPTALQGTRTGVFVGMGTDDYAKIQVRDLDAKDVSVYSGTGNAYCYAAGRISYILGLHGPCMPVDTACSSSLVAIHLACQSLRERECDAALAGGVQLILAPFAPIFLSKARALAPDGHAKTFDEAADGFCRGEGCGVVLLKRLSDALASNDRIHAIIRASAVNHDGHSSAFTVPNGLAQQEVIRTALARARIEPQHVGYVEAHGTGTSLGDPIELRALAAVYGKAAGRTEEPLVVGSVKTNFGHLEGAAGIAGLIKVVLSMQHGVIPRHLNFKRVNPQIALDEGPFVIPTENLPWARPQGLRAAGVSSFGLSGTNAHVLLGDAPSAAASTPAPEPRALERRLHVFTLSAKSSSALAQLVARYSCALDEFGPQSLGDICYTANTGRAHFSHRLVAVVASLRQLKRQLSAFSSGTAGAARTGVLASRARPKVAFLFRGEGAQYAGIGRVLYDSQPAFREVLDRCDAFCRPSLKESLLSVLLESEATQTDPAYQQLALFALECALAQMWRAWGIDPAVLMGHGVGEVAAACVAEVLSLEDGLKLSLARARVTSDAGRDARAELERTLAGIAFGRPRLKLISSVTGKVAGDEVASAQYWQLQLRESERVLAGVEQLHAQGLQIVLEMGPDSGLSERAARGVPGERSGTWLASTGPEAGAETALNSLASLYLLGAIPNWKGFDRGYSRRIVTLPTYAFQRRRHWVELTRRVREPFFTSETDARRDPELRSLIDHLFSVWGEDGAQAVNRRMTAPILFFPAAMQSFFCVARRDRSIVLLDYVGPDESFASSLQAIVDVARHRGWMLTMLASAQRVGSLTRMGWSTTPIGVWQSIRDLKGFTLDGPERKRLRSKVNSYRNLGECRTSFHRVGTDPAIDREILQLIDGWVERKGKRAPFVGMLKREIATGSLDPRYRLYLTYHRDRIESVVLLSPCGRNRGYLMDLEFYRGDMRSGCLEFGITEIIAQLRREGIDYFSVGSTFGLELSPHENQDGAVATLLRSFYERNILNSDKNFQFKQKFSPDMALSFICRPRAGAGDDVMTVLRLLAEPEDNPTFEDWELPRPSSPSGVLAQAPSVASAPHPLLGHRLPVAVRETIFEAELDLRHPALSFLRDHQVFGQILLPATAFLECALSGVEALWPGRSSALTDVVIRQPLAILDGSPHRLQLVLTPTSEREFSFRISSRASALEAEGANVVWTEHVAGKAVCEPEHVSRPALPLDAVRQACAEELNVEGYYPGIRPWGMEFGGHFQGLKRAWHGDGHALGLVRLPNSDSAGAPFRAHPALLDACLHVQSALLLALRTDESATYLPVALERLVVHRPLSGELWSHVRLRPTQSGSLDALIADFRIHDGSGQVVAEIEGFLARRTTREAVEILVRAQRSEREELTYEIDWVLQAPPQSEVTLEREPGYWLVLSDREGLGDQLARCFERETGGTPCFRAVSGATYEHPERGSWSVDPANAGHFERLLAEAHEESGLACAGVVHLWGASGSEVVDVAGLQRAQVMGCASTLHVLQALIKAQSTRSPSASASNGTSGTLAAARCPLWLVTRGVQAVAQRSAAGAATDAAGPAAVPAPWQAPLWGLGRSIAQEHPEAWGGLIDLAGCAGEGEADAIFRELRRPDEEDNIAYRDGSRYVARLSRQRPNAHASSGLPPVALSPNATHLVTGGLGGLGLTVARWMVARGARHLVLVSRQSSPAPAAAEVIAELENEGATVVVLQADVARAPDVARMLQAIREGMPPLEGIVHAAGALADGTLLQQDWGRFEEVMAAKVAGTWNLHRLTQSDPLQYFVCFSSIASLLGTAGQANYAAANAFMDGLAQHRHAQGLPALSIHWGPWADVGMAARLSERAAAQRAAHGIGALAPSEALRMLESLWATGAARGASSRAEVGVISVDWERLLQGGLRAVRNGSLLRELSHGSATLAPAQAQSEILSAILVAAAASRATLLQAYLAELVGSIARLDSHQVDATRPLTEMGFDSLMALEFKERVEADLGVGIPVVALFRGDSIIDFAEMLLGDLVKRHPNLADSGTPATRESAAELLGKLDELDDAAVDSLLRSMLAEQQQALSANGSPR